MGNLENWNTENAWEDILHDLFSFISLIFCPHLKPSLTIFRANIVLNNKNLLKNITLIKNECLHEDTENTPHPPLIPFTLVHLSSVVSAAKSTRGILGLKILVPVYS